MAEQALNAIYLLGEQPDVLAGALIKDFTVRRFNAASPDQVVEGIEGMTLDERNAETASMASPRSAVKSLDEPDASDAEEGSQAPASEGPSLKKSTSTRSLAGSDFVSSFELGQLIFVVGHVAIKQIVYLEIVERELKRRKEQQAAASASLRSASSSLRRALTASPPSLARRQSRGPVQGRQRPRPGLGQCRGRHRRQHGLHPRV